MALDHQAVYVARALPRLSFMPSPTAYVIFVHDVLDVSLPVHDQRLHPGTPAAFDGDMG